ncbi:hypothetical protein SUGI_0835290 [Cryptomeria japonica]|nr:hypothetical protein SUGI_0835290 [Cryptomeria japonica]
MFNSRFPRGFRTIICISNLFLPRFRAPSSLFFGLLVSKDHFRSLLNILQDSEMEKQATVFQISLDESELRVLDEIAPTIKYGRIYYVNRSTQLRSAKIQELVIR